MPVRRRVIATMIRGLSKEVVWVRRYSYFDTAMPRALQLAMSYATEGDIIEFASIEFGYQLGILRIKKSGKFEVEMSPLVKASPSLLKLMSAEIESAYTPTYEKKPTHKHSSVTRH